MFTKIRVELSTELEDREQTWGPNFNMEGVEFHTEVSIGVPEDQASDPHNFMVSLRFAILNQTEGKKHAPYTIDLHAQGWFEIATEILLEKREDLVRVNGASMIFGAMRELISQLTARSAFGPFTVPTLRFLPMITTAPPTQSS